ncbi:MAG: Crp/Fnr family transcriptional regulator [Rhodoferax sp.]|nr:MAG: Crp/Fnr family transcriptional regulator [Rhodoferax sp.]
MIIVITMTLSALPPESTLHALLPTPLHGQCESMRFAAGALLFAQGQIPVWMFFVETGEVVLERHGRQGESACLQRCQHGFVGEASLTSPRYHCDARALRPGNAIRVPVPALRQALQHDSDFALRWIGMLSGEVRTLRLRNERLSLPRIQDRVVHLIETEGHDGHYTPDCPVSQLARQLAVTHEALYRCLARMEQAGLLARTGSTLQLQKNLPPTAVEAPVDKQAGIAPKPRQA